jgi:hypothetical protein
VWRDDTKRLLLELDDKFGTGESDLELDDEPGTEGLNWEGLVTLNKLSIVYTPLTLAELLERDVAVETGIKD